MTTHLKLKGKQRIDVIKVMSCPQIPSSICREAKKFDKKINPSSTSAILRDFVKKNIAVCLNPQLKVGRLYMLTEKGKRLRRKVLKK